MGKADAPRQPINPADYRKTLYNVETVEAPSGVIFKIKKLSAIELLESGLDQVTNPYSKFVEGNKNNDKSALEDSDVKEYFAKVLEIVVEKGILAPRVELEYNKEKKDDVLFWNEISQDDQVFLVNHIANIGLKEK